MESFGEKTLKILKILLRTTSRGLDVVDEIFIVDDQSKSLREEPFRSIRAKVFGKEKSPLSKRNSGSD